MNVAPGVPSVRSSSRSSIQPRTRTPWRVGLLLLSFVVLAALPAADALAACKRAKQSCGLFNRCCSGLTCDYFASGLGGECRHSPPREGEVCTIFSGCRGADFYCKGFQDGLAGRCTRYSKLGESCDGLITLCGDRLKCRQDPRDEDLTIGNGRCFPDGPGTWTWDDDEACLGYYSESVHRALPATLSWQFIDDTHAMTFGSGGTASFGGGVSFEVGGAYGNNGSYGCYRSVCVLGETNAQVASFFSIGEYEDFGDCDDGYSYQTYAGAGFVVGAGRALVFNVDPDDPSTDIVGDARQMSLSVDLSPVYVGTALCTTSFREVITNWQINSEPLAACEDRNACAGPESCVADVSVDAGSRGSGGRTPTLLQIPSGPYAIGQTEVTLRVSDDTGAVAECSAVVDVNDCTPPEVTCAPTVAECQSNRQAFVTPDAPSVQDCTAYSVVPPPATSYPLGATPVRYTVTDAYDNESTCDTEVVVVDTTPPVIRSIVAEPALIWPPNQKMWPVTVRVDAEDACDPAMACSVVQIRSNEPDKAPGERHDKPSDFRIVGPLAVQLRAERLGGGAGRTYTLEVECADATGGNTSRGEVEVSVPHDQRGQPARAR